VIVPECTQEGNATITGALFSLYGASLDGTVEYFAVNVTVGEETSREYVISDYVPVKAGLEMLMSNRCGIELTLLIVNAVCCVRYLSSKLF
jgi:hypothetical protein